MLHAMTSAITSPEIARAASDLRAVLGRLKRRLRQPDDADEITLPQASVLSRLAREGPMTPGALAAADRVRPQSMSTTLSAMEAQGLVARRADPDDGRRVVIALTLVGDQALQGTRRLREERLGRAIADHLTPEEQQTLIAALPLLDRLADAL
jgi:DNA-binding MarR family transcriptional regulator